MSFQLSIVWEILNGPKQSWKPKWEQAKSDLRAALGACDDEGGVQEGYPF